MSYNSNSTQSPVQADGETTAVKVKSRVSRALAELVAVRRSPVHSQYLATILMRNVTWNSAVCAWIA